MKQTNLREKISEILKAEWLSDLTHKEALDQIMQEIESRLPEEKGIEMHDEAGEPRPYWIGFLTAIQETKKAFGLEE